MVCAWKRSPTCVMALCLDNKCHSSISGLNSFPERTKTRFYVCVANLVKFICAGMVTDEHHGMTNIQTKSDIFRREKCGPRTTAPSCITPLFKGTGCVDSFNPSSINCRLDLQAQSPTTGADEAT